MLGGARGYLLERGGEPQDFENIEPYDGWARRRTCMKGDQKGGKRGGKSKGQQKGQDHGGGGKGQQKGAWKLEGGKGLGKGFDSQ